MNRSKIRVLSILLLLSLPYAYGGCVLVFTTGDVDRQKRDTDTSDTSPDFDGRTSPAVIDSTNATDLAGGAFAGGLTRTENTVAGFNQYSEATRAGAFRPLKLPLILQNSLQQIGTASRAVAFFMTAVETKSGTLQGECGGRFSYLIEFIHESMVFDGSFSFENYCDRGVTLSGETDIDGTYGAVSGEFTTAHFAFSDLTVGNVRLDGDVSLDFLHPPLTATFSAHCRDTGSGQVYRIKDYSMNIAEFSGYVEIEIFGTFYHPDYGFVNLSTAEPFLVHHEDDWPTSGIFVLNGKNNTRAELRALDPLSFSVTADTDGDGTFDWDSEVLNWADK